MLDYYFELIKQLNYILMKSLTITLLAAFFCVTVSGINPKNTEVTNNSDRTTISKETNVKYSFELNRHIKKGVKVPTNA